MIGSLKITGLDKLTRNIRRLQSSVPSVLRDVSTEQVRKLDELAMKNLYSTVKSGIRTNDSIEKKVRIEGEFTSTYEYRIRLEYYSKHAEIVEYGGAGEVMHAEDYGHQLWPIGKSQYGTGIYFKPTIKLQQGKHFVSNALFERTQNYASDAGYIGRAYWRGIRSLIASIGDR